jgi:hypothetical protein
MSTKLHDVPNQAALTMLLEPQTITGSTNSAGADLLACDGRCFAVLQVGEVTGTSPSLAGKLQESADDSAWSDIPGASFTAVTESDGVQAIAFDRGQRYVRFVGTVTGTSPSFLLAVLLGQQKKQS